MHVEEVLRTVEQIVEVDLLLGPKDLVEEVVHLRADVDVDVPTANGRVDAEHHVPHRSKRTPQQAVRRLALTEVPLKRPGKQLLSHDDRFRIRAEVEVQPTVRTIRQFDRVQSFLLQLAIDPAGHGLEVCLVELTPQHVRHLVQACRDVSLLEGIQDGRRIVVEVDHALGHFGLRLRRDARARNRALRRRRLSAIDTHAARIACATACGFGGKVDGLRDVSFEERLTQRLLVDLELIDSIFCPCDSGFTDIARRCA